MTQIIKKDGKTIIKTGERINTMNAAQFERDIEPALEPGVNLVIDCTDLIYLASSGLRVCHDESERTSEDDKRKTKYLQDTCHDWFHAAS